MIRPARTASPHIAFSRVTSAATASAERAECCGMRTMEVGTDRRRPHETATRDK